MRAEISPTLEQFKKAYEHRNGEPLSLSIGVTAIAQRGRFFRVKFIRNGRPQSRHLWMPNDEDRATYYPYAPYKVVEVPNEWAHLLFTEPLPAKLVAHDGAVKEQKEHRFDRASRIPPYEYVTYDVDTMTGYRLALFGAYNAMGLIGSEHNGLVLFDNKHKQVVADRMLGVSSGWGGPNPAQVFAFTVLARLMLEDQAGFAAVINKHFGVGKLRVEVRA